MLNAHFDSARKELCIRLGEDESSEKLSRLGTLLQQFLDRDLREIGTAIMEAMARPPKRQAASSKEVSVSKGAIFRTTN